jgi:MFS family permease
MASKTVGTILIILVCILCFPLAIGIVAGVFGTVAGVFSALFGAFFGLIGGVFGAIFGVIGSFFEFFFDWDNDFHWDHDFGFFRPNVFTLAAIIIVIALLSKRKPAR